MYFGQKQLHKYSDGEFSTLTLARAWVNN